MKTNTQCDLTFARSKKKNQKNQNKNDENDEIIFYFHKHTQFKNELRV